MSLDVILHLQTFTEWSEKQAVHTAPRTVTSCPHLIANRAIVVLRGPPGRFLFLFLPLSKSAVGQMETDLEQLAKNFIFPSVVVFLDEAQCGVFKLLIPAGQPGVSFLTLVPSSK